MCSIQHFLQSSSSCVIDVTHKLGTLINNQNFIHMTKHLRYLFAVLLVWVCTVGGYAAIGDTYKLVTSASDLKAGDVLVIASKNGGAALGTTNSSSRRAAVTITITNGSLKSVSGVDEISLEGSEGAWYLLSSTGKYLTSNSKNKLTEAAKTSAKSATISISGTNSDAIICFPNQDKSRQIRQNGSYGFAHYDSTTGTAVQIYKKEASSSTATPTTTTFNISDGLNVDGQTFNLVNGKYNGEAFVGYAAKCTTDGAAGTIKYASSEESVATVGTDGALTIVGIGTTEITATFTPTDTETYATSTATYTITNAEKIDLSEIVFDVTKDKTSKQATGKDELTKGIVTISSTSAALGGYDDYRLYSGKTTFSLSDANRVITSIKFEGGTQYSNLTADKGTYTQSTGLWEGKEATVVFTATSTIKKITKITVTTAEKKELPAPALSFANPTEEVELKEGLVDIQTITKPADFDGTITYVSSDNTTAEVTEGVIKLKKTGEVTIKATSAATDNYAAGSAEYTLKVVDTRADAQISVKEESVDAELSVGLYDPADNVNNPNNVKLTYASSNADITINEADYLAFSKVGSTTVTVSFAGNNNYKPFETSFTLNVVDTRATEAPISIKEQTVTVKLPTEEYEASTNVTNDQKLTLTYAIDNKDFEIDETTGFVVFNKVGSTTVTVSFAGNETYKPFTGTFTLNVEESRTTDEGFKFDAGSYTLDLADGKAEFDANAKLQNTHNLTYTWEISPMTNGENIDASGKATGLKRGTYTITATSQTNNNYLATTATCTLQVTNSAVADETIKFAANIDKGEKSGAAPDQMKKSFVSIVSGRAAFGNGKNYRFYQTYGDQTGETTISTKIGNIIKIEFVGSGNTAKNNSLSNLSTEDERYSTTSPNNGVWNGSAKSVTFTASATAYATNIIITLELPVAKSYTLDEATTNNVIESYENANVTLKRTLEASHWNTFCVPFALDADEVKQYFGEGTELRTYEGNCDGSTVNFATVDNIEAGKPYIMKPGTAVVTDPEFKNVIMVADDLDANGNPQAVGATTSVQMKGIYNHVTLEQNETNLYIGAGNKFYYPADAEACEMNGLRAYFIVPEGTDIKKLRANLDGTVTSLDAIFGTEETNAAVYNLQGLYVGNSLKQLKSGVYIQNGKKIVVK